MLITTAIVWYVVGVASHVYWVTAKYDYRTDYIPDNIFAGFTGPFSWLIGWFVYGQPNGPPRTLIKRRPHL